MPQISKEALEAMLYFRRRRYEQPWEHSPWAETASGAFIPFAAHQEFLLRRVGDGGWPTREGFGDADC